MWKSVTNNKTLPTRLPPMEGQQKEMQYPGHYQEKVVKWRIG